MGWQIKHNKANTRLYNIYKQMKQRCYNTNNPNYNHYGGRGIKICDEWLNKENGFISFYNWAMENNYNDDLTIDRINVNGNYEPSNCRWSTMDEQANNKNSSCLIEYNNEIHTITEWASILKIKTTTLISRIYSYGWSVEKAFNTPIEKKKSGKHNTKKYIYDNKEYTLMELSETYNINYNTLKSRINILHMTVDEAINYKKVN